MSVATARAPARSPADREGVLSPAMPKLHVVITSTRAGREGMPVGTWFFDHARAHGGFDPTLIDLKEVNLPLFDEPKHPRLRQYANEHTKAWSAQVNVADAFVFVIPEYNYGMPPSLLNALDFLSVEWAYKAVGFVSYGGMSGGIRSVQMAKLVITSLKMMPIPEAVAIPFFAKSIDAQGVVQGGEALAKSATTMLDELLKWDRALRTIRS